MEFAEADLLDEKSMFKAIKGADFLVHTASPFPLNMPKDEDDLIKPAVEGTLTALRAARKNKVKRVVITSSIAAMYATHDKRKTHFNTDDWSDPTAANAYEKSKSLAEMAAWKYQEGLSDEEKFELVTINPGFVIGPNLVKC